MKKMIIDFSQELTQSYYVKLLNDDAFNVFTKDILTENEMRYNGEKIIFLPEDYHLIDKALNQLGYKIERRRNPIKKSYDFFDLFFSNSEEIDKLRKHISSFMYMKYARLLSQNINNETFDNSSSDTSYSKLLYFLLDISDYFTSNHFDKKIDNAYIAEYIISVVDLLIPYKILGSLMTSYLYGIDNDCKYQAYHQPGHSLYRAEHKRTGGGKLYIRAAHLTFGYYSSDNHNTAYKQSRQNHIRQSRHIRSDKRCNHDH